MYFQTQIAITNGSKYKRKDIIIKGQGVGTSIALAVAPPFIAMRVPVRGSSLVHILGGIVRDDDLIRPGAPPIRGCE